jgi:glycosyltransferase involved in cell wall biosynthesis
MASIHGWCSTYGFNPRLVPWIKANRHRFDGVVVNGLWQYCGLAARRALSGTNTPYLVFTHGMLDPYFKRAFPLKHAKKWPYWLLSEYWNLRGAYRVLFTSEAEKRLAEQSFWLHRWNPYVVPYGAKGPTGDLQAMKHKGCDLLIDAFAKVAADDPELNLVMAGPDQQQWSAELRQTAAHAGIADRIHWPGMTTGDAKWGAFYGAEAFILPSHQENFGIAVAEAMACGTPVLLSDKVNIADEIAADGAGFMEPDTLDGTVHLLQRWIATSPQDRQRMADQALRSFNQRYDMEQTAKTIIGLFEAAIQRS